MGKYKLISFDMDGVIFEHTNFWLQLHKALGTLEEGFELTKRYVKTDYKRLVKEVVERLWKGKGAEKYFELVNKTKYNPGVKKAIEELKRRGYKLCIISSGPSHLVQRAKEERGIDYTYSNELVIKNNKIVGKFIWPVGHGNKLHLLEKICKKRNISLREVVAIGDDDNDCQLFKAVGFSIAFNTTSLELRNVADVVVESNHLRRILHWIP